MIKIQGAFSNMRPIWKMVSFIGVILLCLFLVIILYGLLFGTRQDVGALKVLQALQTTFVFILPCLLCACLWDSQPMRYLQLDKPVKLFPACWVVGVMLLAIPAINLLSWCNQQITLPSFLSDLEMWMQAQEDNAAALTERFIKADTLGVLALNLLLMALLPAIGEELCFRGVIQKLLQPMNIASHNGQVSNKAIHISVWVSAILFSAMHLQFYGFIPRMLLGAFFGYLLVWSGSLWLPVLAHFTNNAVVILFYNLYYMRGLSADDINTFGTGSTLWAGCLSVILTLSGIWILYRFYHRRNTL